MSQFEVNIKPLSVNEAWQGRRYKTNKYKDYIIKFKDNLPKILKIPETIKISLTFYFSNKASDLDNPVKMILDILQKHYGFNDSSIYEINLFKMICKKGDEKVVIKFEESFINQ